MNRKEAEKLIAHFDTYFHQNDCMVQHQIEGSPHIDVLVYAPNDAYPYWKLVTAGASDYRMPAANPSLGNRNEYMMFIDAEEDLNNDTIRLQYTKYLLEVAYYPISNHYYISYGHSIEWPPEPSEEMIGAYLELPQIIPDPGVLRCKLGMFKTVVCLQVVLLTRKNLDLLFEIGPEGFSNYLYPDEEGERHFLCELKRSEKF